MAERRKRLEELRTSGLKVQVANENYQTAPAAAAGGEEEEERPSVSPPPVTEVEVEEMDDDDDDEAYLEDMRRRALESMNRLVRD